MEPLDPGTSKAASIATAAATVKVAGAPPLSTSKAASCLSPPPRIVPVPRAPLGPPIGGPVGPFISGPGPELPVKAPPSHGISAKMPPPQFEVVSGGVIGVKMPPVGPPPLAPPEMLSTSLPILPPGLGLAPPVGPLPAVLMQPPLEPPAGLLAAVDAAVVRAGAPARPVEKLEWQAHTSPEGIPFFFCKKTGESRWVRPCGPGDTIVEAKAEAEVRKEPQAGSLKEKLGEPETWESIGKTGWTRVETDKGYTYFYHKKQKKTSWTCPPEIAKEVAALDGSLGAADEGGKDEEDGKAAAEETPDAPETEPADGDEDGPKKQTRAERAEKRAHQVEEEQKAAKEKDKLRNFKQLLVEKGVRAFDKYDKWVPKLMHDPRFTAVTSLKERRLLFEMLAKKIETEKRKTQAVCKNRGREAFKELVDKADQLDLLAGRTVEKALASMERRFGDEAQWDAVPERDRERMVAEAVAEATKRVEKQKEEARAKFRAAVTEGLRGKEEDPPAFSKARRWLEHDPSWEQLGSTERENLYGRLARELKDAKRKQDAKKREVQQELEEARKKRKLSEAEEKIFSVLSERMKNPFSMTWEEAKPEVQELQLQKTFGLRDNELEQLWLDYQRRAIDARREAWLCILDAAGFEVIGPELEFEEVVQRAFDANTDVATQKAFEGMPEDVLKESWKQWRERAYELAVEDCQQWLRTCQHLRGCEDVEPTGGDDFDRLMRRLAAKDIRFRRLNGRPEQQTRLLAGRLRELRSLRGQKKDEGEEEEYM